MSDNLVYINGGSIPTKNAIKRLKKDYKEINDNSNDMINVFPLEENILKWYYILTPKKIDKKITKEINPFINGIYYGIIIFPSDYPDRPPLITMLTKNGLFVPYKPICLTIASVQHPEYWNKNVSILTILESLYSFMLYPIITPSKGFVYPITSFEHKKILAKESLEYNLNNFDYFHYLYEQMNDKIKL